MNLDLEPRLNQELELQLVNKGEVKKFKLVGIIEDRVPNKTNGIMEGIIGPVDTNKSNSFIGYIEFYEDIDILKAIDNIIYDAKIDIEKTSQNTMLLQAMGQMGRINFEVVGLVVLITLISATVIYSIFNTFHRRICCSITILLFMCNYCYRTCCWFFCIYLYSQY